MNDLLIPVAAFVLILLAVVLIVLRQRLNYRKKLAAAVTTRDSQSDRFRQYFSSALSGVLEETDFARCTSLIADGISAVFSADTFIFVKAEEAARLAAFSTKRKDEIVRSIQKSGLHVDPAKVPLSPGRSRVFDAPYSEFRNAFSLVDDLTTAVASQKIQRDLGFDSIVSASVKTATSVYAIVVLLPARPANIKLELSQFALLLKAAYTYTYLKEKVKDFEERFDEKFISARDELRSKESEHLSVFNEMMIPAALVDERGVVAESNEALGVLFGEGVNAVGQPLSAVIGEESRHDFIETLMKLQPQSTSEVEARIAGKTYKVIIAAPRQTADAKRHVAVYLVDQTPILNVREELGRTIDSLKSENERVGGLLRDERSHSEEIVMSATAAAFAVSEGIIEVASAAAKQLFALADKLPLSDFISANGLQPFPENEGNFETADGKGRTFRVESWTTSKKRYYSFVEITGAKSAEAEKDKIAAEADRLFENPVPTAYVKDNSFVRMNSTFEGVFREVLATENTFEGFLKFMGESPGSFVAELSSKGKVTRSCRSKDRRYVTLSASSLGEFIVLYAQDFTDEENTRQELRNTQDMLSDSIEFFPEEPFLIVRGGTVSAANMAARSKLGVNLDDPFDETAVFSRFGFSGSGKTLEIGGVAYRVASAEFGNTKVYRLEEVTRELEQRSKIDRLTQRQDLLKELSSSPQYENILNNLLEIIRSDGINLVKILSTGTVQKSKSTAEVYLLTIQGGRVEPSLMLSLTKDEMSLLERGGSFEKSEIPEGTFMNVVSAGNPRLIVGGTSAGDLTGFACASLDEGEIAATALDELARVLAAASSVAIGISARTTAERKFEASDKVTRALVGLTGIGEEGFEDAARKSVDLLRQIFASDSVGIYSAEGTTLTSAAINGSLPPSVSLPGLKFGSLVSAAQIESGELKGAEGLYFAVRSRKQKLGMIFKFVGIPPAPSELSAIGSVTLDLLEARRNSEYQSRKAAQLLDESKLLADYMSGLAGSPAPAEVLNLLKDTFARKYKDVPCSVATEETADETLKAMELSEKSEGEQTTYRANFTNFGLGTVKIVAPSDSFPRLLVQLAVDRIRSLLAGKLPAAQRESEVLKAQADKSKSDYAVLRETVDRMPTLMRNARVEIDNALSRLTFVQGEERVLQEIKLHLASAAKEISLDIDSSTRNQNEMFDAVRRTVMEREGPASRIKRINTSMLTEVRIPNTAFDAIKDLLVNFIILSQLSECELLMMTVQPSPSEAAGGKGKHLSIRLTGREGEVVREGPIISNTSIQTLTANVQKMGYQVDARGIGNELTVDVCEIKTVEPPSEHGLSALLVEDDKVLAYEESQKLIGMFSLLKVAGDAVEASMIFDSAKFDVAFVDLSLPSINGRELCQQIKEAQPNCKTVLLTNREGEERSEGVDYIMQRPLDELTVRNYLRR